jgi:Secretion system C-terminal sorting domain
MKFISIFAIIVILFGLQTLNAQNILINPSFEVWLDTLGINLPLGWYTSEMAFPGTATKSTDAHTGDFALKLVGGDSIAYAATTTIVTAGNQYDFAGWCKCPSLIGGSFVIAWLSMLGQTVGTPTLVPIIYSNSYREYTSSLTAPDSAFFIVVSAAALMQATVYVDDVTLDTVSSGVKETQPAMVSSEQIQISPNPFSHSTVIHMPNSLLGSSSFELNIYDLTGKLVKSFPTNNQKLISNNYLIWNGTDDAGLKVNPGIYFFKFNIGKKTCTRKIILLSK